MSHTIYIFFFFLNNPPPTEISPFPLHDALPIKVEKALRKRATKRKQKEKRRATVLAVAAYYYRNRARMRYDSYLREGYPIASGSVEGACKNLVKDRMERSGMRWTLPMAEAVLRLRAVYLSEHFEQYWPFHVEDRKSTRLNSSHSQISYAVFCLK